jgi:dethiobiotin synthetase
VSGPRLIIAGTDTEVGKTVVSAMLSAALEADYIKPLQSGAREDSDSRTVRTLANLSKDRIHPELYRLSQPLSPHRAAELDGVEIDIERLQNLPNTARPLIIECAGGLLVPVTRKLLQIDAAAAWRAPFVLVARTTLGTINHTLLSIEALESRRLPLQGIVFVGEANLDNERTICEMSGAKRLGRLPRLPHLDRSALLKAFADNFSTADFGIPAHV